MDKEQVLDLLHRVEQGETSAEKACEELRFAPFEQLLEGVNVDLHRALRTGQGEVVFGRGKSLAQLESAVAGLSRDNRPVLATKLDNGQGEHLKSVFPGGCVHPMAGLFSLGRDLGLAEPWPASGEVMVVTAGASDLPVGLEAYGTARFFGLDAGLVPDVGVAGLHRLRPYLEALSRARLLIVVAGMEGALPGVLGGLCGRPVVAVPTSVGYGASLGGLAALLGMLNSCSPGVTVVNIDNGFGAAAFAVKVLK